MLAPACAAAGDAASARFHGLPPTRAYAFEDIGFVAKGARLDFDRFGRLAVIHEGVYAVLNDTVWINLAYEEIGLRDVVVNVTEGGDGRAYYGARETWGILETGPDGKIHTRSLVPPDAPKWTRTASFEKILATPRGVYFGSWNGIVYWDFETQRNQFFDLVGVSCLFSIRDRGFVGALGRPIQFIDTERGVLVPSTAPARAAMVPDFAATLDRDHALLAEAEGRMWVFDGNQLSPWAGLRQNGLAGRISALQGLVDGGVAVGLVGQGLFVFDAQGRLRTALNTGRYFRITSMANREPGVLWVATEETVEKVLYGSPLRTFGQSLGLTVSWPLVARWGDRLIVASEGKLFEATTAGPGLASRFAPTPEQPPGGAWSLAMQGGQLLVGSSRGVFSMQPDGGFSPVLEIRGLSQLVSAGSDLCYAIGSSEIAVLRWRDGQWTEAAPRVPGLPYTPVAHGTRTSAWVEMGGGGVARVWLTGGATRVDVIENDPWTNSTWVNVGVIGDVVVLSASRGNRRFYSETTGTWCDAPELADLLDRPAQWIARARMDDHGVIWASHNEGVISFTPKGGNYEIDTFSFDQINDRYPMVHVLSGEDVWISAGRSLQHVEPSLGPPPWVALHPILVSLFDTRTGTELLPPAQGPQSGLKIPFSQNSLSFRFFAGGYGWRRAPLYEFRLHDDEPWTSLDTGSILGFNGMREGLYKLEVRIAGSRTDPAAITSFAFEIRPPWHRTPVAYAAYVVVLTSAILGILGWSSHFVRKRNRALESLVQERTKQLEATMEKLNEETRNAATLAERDRLAGEIHDSLQQGLSGAILQLDTTLKLSQVPAEIRSRLNVVRNMVSYARQEVQHVVWDMASPLAEGVELDEALRRLVGFINSCAAAVDVTVEGEPFVLSRSEKHHLLRVAQEATTNAVRHASASKIVISLLYASDEVILTVTDDGCGFNPQSAMDTNVGHFGLRGIRSRAKKLGGQVSIQSVPGSGASIRVTVPRQPEGERVT